MAEINKIVQKGIISRQKRICFTVSLVIVITYILLNDVVVLNGEKSEKEIANRTFPLRSKRSSQGNSQEEDFYGIFAKEGNDKVVTAQLGSTAILKCHLMDDSANVTVKWSKAGWTQPHNFPISLNTTTNIRGDQRFLVTKDDDKNNWELKIRYTQESDAGKYKCEVYGHLASILYVKLKLQRATVQLKVNHVGTLKAGKPLRITCLLKNSIERPQYMFWYKDDQVINYNLTDGATVREARLATELIIPKAEPSHSGNYSCVPSNADMQSVLVKVVPPTGGAA